MASEPVQPYVGPMAADISSMQSILVDVAPGGMRRFRRQQEGIAGVIAELSASASVLAGTSTARRRDSAVPWNSRVRPPEHRRSVTVITHP